LPEFGAKAHNAATKIPHHDGIFEVFMTKVLQVLKD
jgi:hypothetical protein